MSEVVRKYELLYIHPGNLPSEDVEKVDEILNGTLEKLAGELLHREDWGVRALAYPVKKIAEGRYILLRIACSAECLKEIERRFKITESVIKFLSLRLADDFVQEEIPEPALDTAEGEEASEETTVAEETPEKSAVAEETPEEVVVAVEAEVSGTEVAEDSAAADESEDEKPGEE
ncbi:MAG TPA: 30S ribosomal protein S6 [Desulfarculaceae bacterium]|nr:30S ribosomal protein S6 [Desulfarculaceae bacterium]